MNKSSSAESKSSAASSSRLHQSFSWKTGEAFVYPQGICRIRKPAYAGSGCAIFQVAIDLLMGADAIVRCCLIKTDTVPGSAGHFRNPPRLPSGAEGAPPADPQCQNPLAAAGAETLPVGGQLADDPGKAAWTGQPEVGAAVEAADSGRGPDWAAAPDPASGFCGKYRPAGEYSDCTCSHLPPGLCPSPRRNTEASPAILDARIARSSFPTRQGLR